MFKIAIVGAGIIAKSHSDAILNNPDCELAAIADIVEEKAKEIAVLHNALLYRLQGNVRKDKI